MVDPAPRAAGRPIVFLTQEAVGWSMQAWQPPADGWIPLGEPQRFATDEEARSAGAPIVGQHSGSLAVMIFPPDYKPPNFRRRK
jgi:hypothetical protein